MNTYELANQYPQAFEALPIPYQNDDCLEFNVVDGILVCKPASGQEPILGEWVSVFMSNGHWSGVYE